MDAAQKSKIIAILRYLGKSHLFTHVAASPNLWRDLLTLYPEVVVLSLAPA